MARPQIIALLVVALALFAAAGADARRHKDKDNKSDKGTLSLTETGVAVTFPPENSQDLGDTAIFASDLVKTGTSSFAGRITWTGVIVTTAPITVNWSISLQLSKGTITASGVGLSPYDGALELFTITGGTGDYEGLTGTLKTIDGVYTIKTGKYGH